MPASAGSLVSESESDEGTDVDDAVMSMAVPADDARRVLSAKSVSECIINSMDDFEETVKVGKIVCQLAKIGMSLDEFKGLAGTSLTINPALPINPISSYRKVRLREPVEHVAPAS